MSILEQLEELSLSVMEQTGQKENIKIKLPKSVAQTLLGQLTQNGKSVTQGNTISVSRFYFSTGSGKVLIESDAI